VGRVIRNKDLIKFVEIYKGMRREINKKLRIENKIIFVIQKHVTTKKLDLVIEIAE